MVTPFLTAITHVYLDHCGYLVSNLHEIPLPEHDPARKRFRQTKVFAAKTHPDPTRQAEGEDTPSTYINEVTHWWVGSSIYGSAQESQNALRAVVEQVCVVTLRPFEQTVAQSFELVLAPGAAPGAAGEVVGSPFDDDAPEPLVGDPIDL